MAEAGPLPLVIGATGHRDLRPEDHDRLCDEVRSFFQGLQAKYPNTPLVVLSALAEGADRLIAEVALELKLRLVVPLPLPADEYKKDFPKTVAEFDDLLKKAEPVFEVVNSSEHPQAQRPECYGMAGGYIARHCQILLALWDGVPSQKVGGTAHVVQFKREGVPPPYGPPRNPLDPVESGPVYHLVTPRQSQTDMPHQAFELIRLDPPNPALSSHDQQPSLRKFWDNIFWRTNTFNRDEVRLKDRLAPERQRAIEHLLPAQEREGLPAPVISALSWLARADVLAQHFQRLTHRTVVGLLLIALLMVVSFQLYSFLESRPPVLAWAYLGLFFVGLSWYVWVRFVGRYQDKFLDYRALAEGLRVHLFWRLAGLRRAVSDDYLRKFRTEMDWIRQALRVWTIPAKGDAAPAASKPRVQALPLVLRHWLQDQQDWFIANAQRNRRKLRNYGLVGAGLFLVSFVLTVVKVFVDAGSPILLAVNWTLVLGSLLLVYSQIQGHAEHAQQYSRMGGLFMRGSKELQNLLAAGRHGDALKLLEDLGQEALIENGDWLLLHRARRIQPPGLQSTKSGE